MNTSERIDPRPGDAALAKPPAGVQVSLMGLAPSLSTGHHWSECIVEDRREPLEEPDGSPTLDGLAAMCEREVERVRENIDSIKRELGTPTTDKDVEVLRLVIRHPRTPEAAMAARDLIEDYEDRKAGPGLRKAPTVII